MLFIASCSTVLRINHGDRLGLRSYCIPCFVIVSCTLVDHWIDLSGTKRFLAFCGKFNHFTRLKRTEFSTLCPFFTGTTQSPNHPCLNCLHKFLIDSIRLIIHFRRSIVDCSFRKKKKLTIVYLRVCPPHGISNTEGRYHNRCDRPLCGMGVLSLGKNKFTSTSFTVFFWTRSYLLDVTTWARVSERTGGHLRKMSVLWSICV